jgi:hypothetical protein
MQAITLVQLGMFLPRLSSENGMRMMPIFSGHSLKRARNQGGIIGSQVSGWNLHAAMTQFAEG